MQKLFLGSATTRSGRYVRRLSFPGLVHIEKGREIPFVARKPTVGSGRFGDNFSGCRSIEDVLGREDGHCRQHLTCARVLGTLEKQVAEHRI
jgi:hypothetical protein